jgi:hypothetical protein
MERIKMAIGRTAKIDEISLMTSFFPGDSLYMFVGDCQIKDETGPVMLHIDAAGYLFTLLSRFCFSDLETAKAYLDKASENDD